MTFEKKSDMDKIKVRIKGGDSEEATLDLSTYYVSSDYTQTPFNIDVTTSYKKINFDTTEGEVDADGCLEFNGEMTTNLLGNFFTYEIKYKKGDEWVSDANGWIENSADASETGGTIYLGIKDNNTLDDRDAKIIVKYPSAEPKEVQVHQYANTEEVTYTVISNVNDGVNAYFYKDSGTTELERKDPVQFKNGVVEYSKPKIYASKLYVKIEGGLPDSSVTYTLDTKDGSREEVLSSGEQTWSPKLVYGKTINRYTWDDNADLDKREYSSATTFSIDYDETVEKNYTIMKSEFIDSGATCMLQTPSVDWVVSGSGYTSNISANTWRVDRSTVLRYYIKEDKSVFLDYKITQGKGDFVFKFNTSVSAVTTSGDGKTASATTDFTKQTLRIDLSCIDSYVTSSDVKKENKDSSGTPIGFIASVRDSNVKCTIEGGYVCFELDKNTCTKSRHFTVAFIQKRSNKRILLTLTQSAVICDVGDVYCYDTSNGNYYFVNVLSGDTIGTNATPIGITIMPTDNGANANGKFARVIALTEKNSDTYHAPLWRKSDGTDTVQSYDYKWIINTVENAGEEWYASLGTEGQALKYKNYYEPTGLCYAKTDRHAHMPMIKLSDHYVINPLGFFTRDPNVGDSSHKNCLCDFNGFQKTQYSYKNGGGELFEMCHEYETVGTKKGEWFLGGAGEMACLVQNIGLINDVIRKLNSLNYSVTEFNFNFQPDDSYFKHKKNNGSYLVDFYWTVTNHGRVKTLDSLGGGNPTHGSEYSSWVVALGNGTMQWGIHRAGTNESAGSNQTRARVRLMLLVDTKNNHVPSELTNDE